MTPRRSVCEAIGFALREPAVWPASGVMPANRMNRDEFYGATTPHDDARLRRILWAVYWRGNAQFRDRIEDELLDRLAASPALAGPELIFLRARIADRRGGRFPGRRARHQVPAGAARPPGVPGLRG